jgi:serine/threonine protein kinase/predicted Zn-dependent protease
MADAQWQKVREIFDSALRHKPDERLRFVNEVCGDDKTVHAEVESLLSSHDGAESFMETPAVAKVADVIEAETKKLETGRCFGHYEIIEQIGEGGMGEVYLARDKKLDRNVAIKILDEKLSQDGSNLQRLISEAKAASALNHPNILTIYEFGEAENARFIVSEYIEGKTLREIIREARLSLPEILDISIQVTGALAAAHKAHLVHRDIKPENVMIRPDGYVKVLDFGLAKLVEQKNKSVLGSDESTVRQNLTAKGVILGTVNYMSPEQAKGERVDERTDTFSLGAIVYEMMTGRTPFAGDSISETFANLINAEAQPLSRFSTNVPDELQRIVSKMLRKNRDERYQTMKDVLTDLRDLRENLKLDEKLEKSRSAENANATAVLRATTGDANLQTAEAQNTLSQTIKGHKPLAAFVAVALLIGAIGLGYYFFYTGKPASSVGEKKSIAVLPFKPLNTDSRDEALEMGMAETLITRLSNLKQVVVRPMSAVRKYTDPQQDSIKAGQELQTEVVLDGSIQKAGERVRMTVRLINTRDGTTLWSEQFDENFTDIFKMQDSIAERITNALALRLSRQEKEQLAKHYTDSADAYQLYLQGEYLWLNRRKDNWAEQSLTYYQRALAKDPNFALAYIGIADGNIRLSGQGKLAGREAESEARSNIMKALEIDDTLAEAHNAWAELKYQYEYDWASAEKEFKKAIELNPNVAAIHLGYGWFLMSAARFDEAATEMEKAREFDPSSLTANVARGRLYYFSRQYDQALQHFQNLIAVEPNSPAAHFSLCQIYLQRQMYAEFFAAFIKYQELIGTPAGQIEEFQKAFKVSGFSGLVRKALDVSETKAKTEYVPPSIFALLNTHLGQKDEAFAWLEKSFDERDPLIVQLKTNPEFDTLRDDPRFQDLLRRVGLSQ